MSLIHVLADRRVGPQELARLAVERVDHAGLAGDAGHDAAPLPGLQPRVDPAHLRRIRRHGRVDENALVRVVEVPVVDEVLIVPGDLARFPADRQRRVVVQVLVERPAEHELGRRRRNRRAHVDQVQHRVVARHHPGPDVHPLLVRHVAPGLVSRLAGRRDQPGAPQVLTRGWIVRGDHARHRSGQRAAAPAGDELAVGDERPGGLAGGVHRVVEDLRLPRGAARRRVEGVDVVVGARIEYVVAVERETAVRGLQPPDPLRDVVRHVLAVLPTGGRR